MQFAKKTISWQRNIEFTRGLSFAFVVTGETIVKIRTFVVQPMTDLEERENGKGKSKTKLT